MMTLAAFIDAYIADRTDAKPRTIINLKAARKELVGFFGADRALRDISDGDADDFSRYLLRPREGSDAKRKALGQNTARRVCGRAKQFFRAAIRKRLVQSNPFADLKTHVQGNAQRDFYVTRDAAQKILEKCPDIEWKLIFALSRFGGLRCPSETLSLTWNDIDFEKGRMLARSPKTAHHEARKCDSSRCSPNWPRC